MPNSDLLPSLLSKPYENQLALETSIMEISNWVNDLTTSSRADRKRADQLKELLDGLVTRPKTIV